MWVPGRTADKPKLNTQKNNLKRVLDHYIAETKRRKTTQSYDEEVANAKKYMDFAFHHDKNTYKSMEQRISWSLSEAHEFRPHLNLLYGRVKVARHLQIRIPDEESMRYACRYNKPDLALAQLRNGYHVNARIYQSSPSGGPVADQFTTPLLEAACFPNLVTVLLKHGANPNMTDSTNRQPILIVYDRWLRAKQKPVERQDWHSDHEARNLPYFVDYLLQSGCKRPPCNMLHSMPLLKKRIRVFARKRWKLLWRVVKLVAKAAAAFRELYMNAHFKPGGEFAAEIKRNWEAGCAEQRARVEAEHA